MKNNNDDHYSSSTEDVKQAIFRIISYLLSLLLLFVATNGRQRTQKLIWLQNDNSKNIVSQCKAECFSKKVRSH